MSTAVRAMTGELTADWRSSDSLAADRQTGDRLAALCLVTDTLTAEVYP